MSWQTHRCNGARMTVSRHTYDRSYWKCYISEIYQIEKLRFLGILRYEFRLRFWSNLNLYRRIWVSRFGEFRGCSCSSGICHANMPPVPRMNASRNTHRYGSSHTCEWTSNIIAAMSHVWMHHLTHLKWHILSEDGGGGKGSQPRRIVCGLQQRLRCNSTHMDASRDTHRYESCPTCMNHTASFVVCGNASTAMAHIWMYGCVTWHIWTGSMSHIWVHLVIHTNVWVVFHMSESGDTYQCESCLTYEWVMWHI